MKAWESFPTGIEGWTGIDVEVGKGKFYNDGWPKAKVNQVCELDGKKNYDLTQKVELK